MRPDSAPVSVRAVRVVGNTGLAATRRYNGGDAAQRLTGDSGMVEESFSLSAVADRFGHTTYTLRRRVFQVFGGSYQIFGPDGDVVLFAEMKRFKLKEDIRVYTGEDMATEVLTIQARQMLDFAASYDVVDARNGEQVGALRRKGLKSLLKDEWLLLDPSGTEIGTVKEDRMTMAVIRRLFQFIPYVNILPSLIPQTYNVAVGETPVAVFAQNFNPFVYTLTLDFSADDMGRLDRRLGLAAAVLLGAVEGKQG